MHSLHPDDLLLGAIAQNNAFRIQFENGPLPDTIAFLEHFAINRDNNEDSSNSEGNWKCPSEWSSVQD